MRLGTAHGSTILSNFEDQPTRASNPETLRGLTALYKRGKVKLFCKQHVGLQLVDEVVNSQELDRMTMADVRLACGCQRIAAINCRKEVA